MKKLFLLMLILGIGFSNSYSQKLGESYAFKNPLIAIEKWDHPNRLPIKEAIIYYVEKGVKFTVIDLKDDYVVIELGKLKYPSKRNKTGGLVHYIDSCESYGIFSIPKIKFDDIASTFTTKLPFVLNAMVLPAKFRFANKKGGDFDFTQSLSVGPVVVIPLKSKKISKTFSEDSASIICGLTFNNVAVDEKTVPEVYTTKATVVGISPIIGFNVKKDKVGFGLICGLDVLLGQARRNWVYRNSPWVGISVGTSLF